MKPQHSLVFLLLILFVSLSVTWISPGGEYDISDNYFVKLPSWEEFIETDVPEYANIDALLATKFQGEIEKDTIVANLFRIERLPDDLPKVSVPDTIRANADSLRSNVYPMEYADDLNECLYPFFEKLTSRKKSDVVRVFHFGDSQTEGDRITSVIRENLQSQYGGNGLGLLPIYNPNHQLSKINVSYEGDWERYNRYAVKEKQVRHNRFGALLSFCRFTPLEEVALPDSILAMDTLLVSQGMDSLQIASTIRKADSLWQANHRDLNDSIVHTASMTIRKYARLGNKAKIKQCRIFCGNNKVPFTVTISKNDSVLFTQTVETEKPLHTISYTFDDYTQDLKISFSATKSPEIYGVSLEDTKGIMVDNIPLRGSSGLEFSKASYALQKAMYKRLKPDLIILEFGVNVVPTQARSYAFYERGLTRQIKRLRLLAPEVPIVIVGLSDMSQKKGTRYESFPQVALIRDAQRNAAFKNGCAFWDTYQAMGGENSMPSWVFAKPALANKDFAHFNHRGARIIGNMFSNSMLSEIFTYQNIALK